MKGGANTDRSSDRSPCARPVTVATVPSGMHRQSWGPSGVQSRCSPAG
jgi:hypothetical protein